MSNRSYILKSMSRLILLAFVLSLVMAVQLAAGNGFLKALLAGELPVLSIVLVLMMVVVATGAIISAFTATLKPSILRAHATVASGAMALITGLEASHLVSPLPPFFYLFASLTGQTLFTYGATALIFANMKFNGRAASIPPAAAAGAVLLFGTLGFAGQSFISLNGVVHALPLVRDLAMFVAFTAVLLISAVHLPMRLDKTNMRLSLMLRLPSARTNRQSVQTLGLMAGGTALSMILGLVAHVAAPGLYLASVMSLAWVGIAVTGLRELAMFTGEQKHGNVTAKIAPESAKRFLKRHLSDKQAWAATTGIKTTNFVVDHDPGGALHNQLPASIMQIRGEEIQRCIADVLGPIYLHSHVVGHRILGAMDPEVSVRPCTDALKMFASLYLDAGPLVERRLKGLAELLPIVDSGLWQIMRKKDISAMIRRNLWFFHFDFGWIDQHVIHTPKTTKYDVRMATLSSHIRNSMMEYLEKTGGVGNFVWIGPDARERLLQEAPTLSSVIEACPIPGENGKDELLMFIIKFEQLIPRLQRYFDLDTMRRTIMDFEPSQESLRLHNLLALQIAKARTVDEVLNILSSLVSVPWRGFKEKDNALHLILNAHQNINKIMGEGIDISMSEAPGHHKIHERLLECVRQIGYPSQILHNAQIKKIALRDVNTLLEVAGDAHHPRFEESWLLLSTGDSQRFSRDDRRAVFEFLARVPLKSALLSSSLVQCKAVDAWVGLARGAQEDELPVMTAALHTLVDWFGSRTIAPESVSLLIDAVSFIQALKPSMRVADDRVFAGIEAAVMRIRNDLGESRVHSLVSRWQEFRAPLQKITNAA